MIFIFINCEFVTESHTIFTTNIKTNNFSNTDIVNINSYLLYYIGFCELRRYNFHNINQMIINIISDMCYKTYANQINNPMPMVERRLIMKIAKNPQLRISIGRNKNHPLIKKD